MAILLAGLGRHVQELGCPEMADRPVLFAVEHVQDGHVPFFAGLELLLVAHGFRQGRRIAVVVAVIGVAGRRQQPQVLPAALLGEVLQALEGRLRNDDEVDALADVQRGAIQPVEEVRAAGARLAALRPEHEAVDRQRVLARREQLRELDPAGPAAGAPALEDIVLGHFAALGQGAALLRDALDVPPQLHLLFQQGIACLPIGGAFIGKLEVFEVTVQVLLHARQTADGRRWLPQA